MKIRITVLAAIVLTATAAFAASALGTTSTDANGMLPNAPAGTIVGHCVVFKWKGSLSPLASPWLFSYDSAAKAKCVAGARLLYTPGAHVFYALTCNGGPYDGFTDEIVPGITGNGSTPDAPGPNDPSAYWGKNHYCTSVTLSTTRPNTDAWWQL